jgi:hypothetical protein
MKTSKILLTDGTIRMSFFVFLVLMFVQCTGPRGYDGQDGIDGDVFAYSAIYDVYPEDWTGDVDGYYASLPMPEITNDIYENGAVLVYRLVEVDPKSFNMLPYTYVDNALTRYMDFDAFIGRIDLYYKEVFDGINDTFAPEDVMSFKVVIIEGIRLANLKTMVNVKDFNAVSKLLKVDTGNSKEIMLSK